MSILLRVGAGSRDYREVLGCGLEKFIFFVHTPAPPRDVWPYETIGASLDFTWSNLQNEHEPKDT